MCRSRSISHSKTLLYFCLAVFSLFGNAVNAAVCSYKIDNEWNTGFNATVSITNNGNSAIQGWAVNWNFTRNSVANFWNAAISGTRPYTASNMSYNASIPTGASVSFGITGNKNGGTAEIPAIQGALCGTSPASSLNRSSLRSSAISSSLAGSSVRSSTAASSLVRSSVLASSSVKSSIAAISSRSNLSVLAGYKGIVNLPGRIQAENYTTAFDTTVGNTNTASLTCTYYGLNVDVQNAAQGGCNIGWTAANETLDYAIGNANDKYDLSLTAASRVAGKRIRVLADGNLLGTVTTTSNSWGWQVNKLNGVTIPSNSRLTFEFVDGDTNLDFIDVTRSAGLTLLDNAIELSRSTVDDKSYSALGQQDKPDHPFAGAMGGQVVSYRSFQYVVYYQSTGAVTIARRDLRAPTILWEKSVLQNYRVTTDDRHNKMDLAISEGDGVIHIAFDHHTTPALHYASTAPNVANNPRSAAWNNSTFTYKENFNQDSMFSGPFAASTVTYPDLSKIGDGVMMSWRSGGQGQGRVNLAIYDSRTQNWSIRRQITSESGIYRAGTYTSDSRGPYTGGVLIDDQNNLHLGWLWREQSGNIPGVNYRNHGLYYAMSKDLGATWIDTTGVKIGDGKTISIDNAKEVWNIPMVLDPQNANLQARINPDTQEFEIYVSQERNLTDTTRVTFRYRRALNGSWSRAEVQSTPGGIGVMLPPTGAPNGPAQRWDYSRLYTEGIVSVAFQREPTTPGQPTPLIVIDYRFAQ